MLHKVSIRARIALSIFVFSTGLLVAMSLLVYVEFERQLRTNLDDTLRLQGAANQSLVNTDRSPPDLSATADVDLQRTTGEAVLRLYDARGRLLVDESPASATAAPELDVVLETLREQQDIFRTVALSDNEEYRIIAEPIRHDGRIVAVLVTGIEWSRVDQPLQTLRLILAVAVPIAAAALAGGAYLIARNALRPVAHIVATAQRITQGDLHQRIAVSPARDEIGELATTLNSMIARLAETVERERRFTADASHELRTPLAAIETAIDVTLTHDRRIDEYQRVLQTVRKQTQRLRLLAQQLLLLSRMDAQALQTSFVLFDLGEVVQAVVEAFGDTNSATQLSLTIAHEGMQIHGDIELLARALTNILENAVTHVGPNVALAIDVRATSAQVASVTITDNGPGISGDLAAAVFQRFRRGSASRSGDGTGLGLAIVDAVCNVHGGSVRLLPRPAGEGSTFELTLPLSKPVPR